MYNQFANVIVDILHEKLDRSFQYLIPKELETQVVEGVRVRIPFGNGNRMIIGYVIELTNTPLFPVEKMKTIQEVVTDTSTSEARLVALAAWMKEQYGSTMIQALKTVLPVKKKIQQKENRIIKLAIDIERTTECLKEFEKKRATAKLRLLEALMQESQLEEETLINKLNVSKQTIKSFESQGLVQVESSTIYRNPVNYEEKEKETILLNEEQSQVTKAILEEWKEGNRVCLIQGVTGSGKTQVYMKLIETLLEQHKQVIVLIPEIALTYQTVMRFYHCFGSQVSFLNSRMSLGERYDQFERAKQGDIQIMVGPRSALFTPFPNLGLIVIDEEHETTYKSETSPRYHARETAIKRAEMEGAHVVLGSATPSVESYYRGSQKEYRTLFLKERYGESFLPKVEIVDLREELKAGNRSILSLQLQDEITHCLKEHQQVMLFLNRRGYVSFLSCRECGEVIKCPHCDVSLSAHRNGRLICHYCGYETAIVKNCPACHSPYISGFRAGTQQIEDIVKKKFPEARILRMDFDTTKHKHDHEKILSAFANKEADILIGTQMIVKGHDFPEVTLVGVIAADLSLNSMGYRASERTFQLITQAVGRAGRGEKPGKAIIQTYQPEHYSIVAAANQDYQSFYQEEISYRMLLEYPPIHYMVAIFGNCAEEELLSKGMEFLKRYINKIYQKEDLGIIGPAPDAVSKINDIYRQVIYLKHEKCDILIKIKNELERYIKINPGFDTIHIQFDFTI